MNQEYGPAFTPIDKPGKNLSSLLSYKNKYNRPNSELSRSIKTKNGNLINLNLNEPCTPNYGHLA